MKRTALFLLLIITTMILVSASALADTQTVLASGECGENVTWEVWENEEGVRTLEVSGAGPISESVEPYIEEPYIKRIIVNEGITSICDNAFYNWFLTKVQELSLPASCISIGEYAFYSDNLRSITLSEGLQKIGSFAFVPSSGFPHAYCVAVIPNSVTDIGNGALNDLIPAVYPSSKALAYCRENEIDNYILLNSTGSNSHRIALLKAVAQVEDVPLRYRSLAVSVLQSMSLTNNQCDVLHDYVLEEEKRLKIAMLDNSMTTNEIIGFLQRFIAKMNDVGVQISYEITFINGFPGVKLTATVNGKETKVDVYRTEYHTWNVKNVTPSQENGYQYVETEDGIMITGYSGNETDLAIPASINNIPVVSIVSMYDGFPYGITSLTIPDGVKTIGSYAFDYQDQLESLKLPDSLESIGNSAFSGCSSLRRLTIPSGVTNISDFCFAFCSNLSAVTIQEGVLTIGNRAFMDCANLNSVTIPSSVTTIGNEAFASCSSLTNITIPDGITRIGEYTFYSCSSLNKIFIPKSVITIDYGAFYGCTALKSVIYDGTEAEWKALHIEEDNDPLLSATVVYASSQYPESAHPYENNAYDVQAYSHPDAADYLKITFSADTETEDSYDYIIIEDSINSRQFTGTELAGKTILIKGSTFRIMLSSNDSIPAYGYTIESITAATKDEYELTFFSVSSDGVLTGYSGSGGNVVIPSVINGQTVTRIGNEAFWGYNVTSITIPDSVTSIGTAAFSECTVLTSVTIPNSVTSIGTSAFQNCFSLTDITIPDSVTSIGDYAFYGCFSLTDITIPDSVTSIGVGPFAFCTSLTNITVSKNNPYFCSVDGILLNKARTELINYPIGDSDSVYVIPQGVTSVNIRAFAGCTRHFSIIIPASVTDIGEGAFECCSGLTSVTFMNGVTSISGGAFAGCSGLTSVTIPDSVTSIGGWTFYNCSALTSIFFSGTRQEWNSISVEDGNDPLLNADIHFLPVPNLVLPSELTKIESEAFAGLPQNSIVYVPDSVTSIAEDAFDEGTIIVTPEGSPAAEWADTNGFECYEQ